MSKERSLPDQRHIPHIKRAPFIVGALLAMAITGCSAFETHDEKITNTPPPATPAISESPPSLEIFKTDQEIIKEEAQRLRLHYSAYEQELWPIFHNNISLMSREQKAGEAQKRIVAAIMAMGKSENPYFGEVARYLKELFNRRDFSIRLVPTPLIIVSEKTIAAMGTDMEIQDGKLHRLIVVDANLLLENPHLIEIALQLMHELEHIKKSIAFEKSLDPSLSVDQKLSLELQRPFSQNTVVLEESDALGREAQAYIHSYGLGFYQKPKLEYQRLAGAFIRSGANPQSIVWKKFVAQELLGIKNWKPKGNYGTGS